LTIPSTTHRVHQEKDLTARDISSHGFYFRISRKLRVEMKIPFSIMPPWEAADAFSNGPARVMRVEEISRSAVNRVGVGAPIEGNSFGQTELPGC
jgi:hypothetical protein